MSTERLEKIIEKYNALQALAKKHEVLHDAYLNGCGTNQEDRLRKEYEQQIDANRDLQIGIVGRVKAGKSSLLNALLFGGESILPKAATPMTAALTVLSYSEKLKVTVRFFEDGDFAMLKEKSAAYENKISKLEEEFMENARKKPTFDETRDKERAIRMAKQTLHKDIGLSGAYDQYQQIKASSISPNEVAGQVKELFPKSVDNIKDMLADYVGSEGKYMPFTQSVEIAYPNEKLKGIRIVDTPGFNDPVPSRQERAYQLLKASDVVLILSSAGRFLDASDKDVLDKITKKDGLRELFIVASQIDTQLLGDEYEGMPLEDVRSDITSRLSQQARSVLSTCNESGAFDQLINDDGGRVILTSGDCQSMFLTFANKESWDENKKKIWENLCEGFKDYFSDKDAAISRESLKQLGNIDVVEHKIESVKQKKKDILTESADKFCTTWESAADELKKAMQLAVQQQINRIKVGNIDALQNEKNSIESFCLKVETGIANAVNNAVDDWRSETTKEMMSFVNELQADAKSDARSAKTEFTKHHSYTTGMLFWKKEHSYTTQHTRVSPVQLRSSVEDYVAKVNNNLRAEILDELSQLKRKISSKIAIVWATKAADQNMDEDAVAVKISAIIESLNIPDFKLPEDALPAELKGSGAKEDAEGDHLLAVCRSHLNDLANRMSSKLIDEIARYANAIKTADLASKLLERYRKDLDNLIHEIENKDKSIKLYEGVFKELEAIA